MRLNLLLVAAAALVSISNAAPQSSTSVAKVSTDAAPSRFLRAETKTQVGEDSFDPEEEERLIFYGKLDKVDDILKQMNLADDVVLKKLVARGKGGVEQLVTSEKGVKKITIMTKNGKKSFTNIDIDNMRKIEANPLIKSQIKLWKTDKRSPLSVIKDLKRKKIPQNDVAWEASRLYSAFSGRKFSSLNPTGF
ncbi:hypothetical protein P3T76_010653 [Phytophthora citrophthora]|uniref:RxLR effector protein n=1 Tax=Phytophthora citrophthora TaxID=4793 RepID=A0AAD9GBH5_9STRA|nr:hypothetical protein P3T76_010653 [Phytophthora citrophthora]